MKGQLKTKTLSLVLYMILAGAIAYLLVVDQSITLKVGEEAPLDDKILLLSGQSTFRRLQKGPMLVNFWAPWCPPCRQELPTLVKVAQKYEGRVIFVGAAVDSLKEDILVVKTNYALSFALGQVSEEVSKRWRGQALPTTYLLDSHGVIAWAHAGVVHEEELISALEALLKP